MGSYFGPTESQTLKRIQRCVDSIPTPENIPGVCGRTFSLSLSPSHPSHPKILFRGGRATSGALSLLHCVEFLLNPVPKSVVAPSQD